MTEPKPGIYEAKYVDGTLNIVAIVTGPNHRPAMIPIDPPKIILEIVEYNWKGVVETLTPFRKQGGMSSAYYFDDDDTIDMTGTT